MPASVLERRWQREAADLIAAIRRTGGDRALIAACPGAGKTLLAALLVRGLLQSGAIDCAVVVVPTRNLKTQWADSFAAIGVVAVSDIDNGTLEDRKARGMVLFDSERPVILVTYAQVASFPELMEALSSRQRVFAVFDEVHHADDEADYGQALVTGFERAIFKLSLSGTPFTTKGARLAFCDIERRVHSDGTVTNRTKTDYEYSYGQALQATGAPDDPEVVRSVAFARWNGHARWKTKSVRTGEEGERLVTGQRKQDPLAPLVDPENPSFHKMLAAAIAELNGIREHHRNAGMLITAIDKDHAEAIERLLREMGVTDVSVVVYDTPGATRRIQAFSRSHDRVLIAIKMVSEGVDIKRLRVGVYASNVLTRLFFTQFIGRFIRWDDPLGAGQSATVFVPEHVILMEYAREIEAMIVEATKKIGGTGDGPGPPDPKIVIAKTGDGQLNGELQHGIAYAIAEDDEVKEWAGPLWHKYDHVELRDLYRRFAQRPIRTITPTPTTTGSREVDYGRLNEKLVARLIQVGKTKGFSMSYEKVQAWANRAAGIPKKDKLTPPSKLQVRLERLRELFARVLDGDVPRDLLAG